MKYLLSAVSGAAIWGLAAAQAQGPVSGTPEPGGIGMQAAHSALADDVHFFHNVVLLPIITIICLFVLALLIWVMVRYNSKANPTPRKFSHNTLVEIVWTGVPILILLIIALFSFDLLFKEDVTPDGKQVVARADGQTTDFVFKNDFPDRRTVERPQHIEVLVDNGSGPQELAYRKDYELSGLGDADVTVALKSAPSAGASVIIRGGRSTVGRGANAHIAMAPTMTIKAVGRQWLWSYSYPDFGDFEFFSRMTKEEDTTPDLYRLETDNHVVVPVGETIRVTTTAADVIHSWAVPSFAVKIDAVPGRINETWFNADKEGLYYGQCSEICGIQHAFMPITIEVVSRPEFEAWVDSQRELAGLEPMFDKDSVKLASAASGAGAK